MPIYVTPNFIDQAVQEARQDFSSERRAMENNFNRWPRYTPEHEAYERELERLTYEEETPSKSLDGQLSLFRGARRK